MINLTVNQELLHAIQSSDSDAILEHHGVKGMKWGIRRWRSKSAQKKKLKRSKKASKVASKSWNTKYYNRHQMSSSDLQKATKRLRMENDFAEQVRRANQIQNTRVPKNNNNNVVKSFGKAVGNSVIDTGVKTLTRDLMTKSPNHYSPMTKKLISEGQALGREFRNANRQLRDIWK